MIDRRHDLPIVRQGQALGLARSTAYSSPKPASPADLALMRRSDELHLQRKRPANSIYRGPGGIEMITPR